MPHKHQSFESNGPDVRIRGNAHQVYEKYLALARDANASGDRVLAEGFYQHAEHYFRILSDSTDPQSAQRQQRGRDNGRERQTRDEAVTDSNGAAEQMNGTQGPAPEAEAPTLKVVEEKPARRTKSASKAKSSPKEEREPDENPVSKADGEQPANA